MNKTIILSLLALAFLLVMVPNVSATTNTSFLGVKFDVSDFSFADAEYVPGAIVFFNTTESQTDLILMISMNVKKLTGGPISSQVWTRIKVDGNSKLEEDLRALETTGDEGSTGTKPFQFNVSAGEHNISMEFRRTGGGSIEVNDIDVNLGQLLTTNGSAVRGKITNGTYTHSSTSFIPAFNWTINKTNTSQTFYAVKQTIQADISATAGYYFYDLTFNHNSPFWNRWLSGSTDIGSMGGNYLDLEESGELNYSIYSRTSAGNVTVNLTIIDFDMRDNSSNLINNFHTDNTLTNLTNFVNYSAGINRLANKTVTIFNGTSYFFALTSSFRSVSGTQTPTYFINSSELSQANCYSKKERYLSSNSDIGNVFIYTICDNLTVGNNYTFNLYLEVPAGETVEQFDESLCGFEVTPFDIATSNLAPIPNEITNPEANSNQSGVINITWSQFYDPNNDTVTYNVSLYNSDNIFNQTINTSTGNLSQLFNSSTVTDGDYIIYVIACDPSNACSNSSVNFTIDNTEPSITLHYPTNFISLTNTTYTFNWTVTDNLALFLQCNLTVDNTVQNNFTVNNGTSTNYSISGFNIGEHYWDITCTDDAGNINTSLTFVFTVLAPPPGGSSGGGTPACSDIWQCLDWEPIDCPSTGQQTRVCVNTGTCASVDKVETQECTYVPEPAGIEEVLQEEEPIIGEIIDVVEEIEVEETAEDLTVGKAIRMPTEVDNSTNIFLYFIAAITMGIVVLFSIAVMSQYKPPKEGERILPVRPKIIFDKTIIWKKS